MCFPVGVPSVRPHSTLQHENIVASSHSVIWNYVKVLSNVGLSLCNCLGSRICAGVNSGYKAIASLCYLRTGSPLIYLGANNNKEVNFVNKTDSLLLLSILTYSATTISYQRMRLVLMSLLLWLS